MQVAGINTAIAIHSVPQELLKPALEGLILVLLAIISPL